MRPLHFCALAGALATFVQPALADSPTLACNVSVTVSGPASTPEVYTKDFALRQGSAFSDDFSSPTRQRTFDAVMAREANSWVVSINYFNDIGTFDAVGFSGRLTVVGGTATTSGTTDFATSLPSFRRYVTAYTLTCRKQ